YIVTVTGANGCTAVNTAVITEPPAINISYIVTPVTSGNDGVIDITISNGVSPYQYAWSNGMHTQDISNLAAGTYSVTVSDANNCTATAGIIVNTSGCNLMVMTTHINVSCYNGSDGSITLFISGGAPPYAYTWNTGQTQQNISGLSAGTYTVTITASGGCIVTTTAVVTQPAEILISAVITDAGCNQSDGSTTVTVTGGTAPYTYNWNTGADTQSIAYLQSGSYFVTITDNAGCTAVAPIIIGNNGAPLVTLTQSDISCYGASDGSVTANVSGGVSPYSYIWNTGCTDAQQGVSTAGTYIITVTDVNGCMAVTATYISEPDILEIQYAVSEEIQGNDGAINIMVSGGTQPYSFLWSGGQTLEDISGLQAGDYTVTITDANGCTAIEMITIAGSLCDLALNAVNYDISCYGQSSGDVDLTVSNDIEPTSYTWNNGSVTQDLFNIPAGSYTVTVTDDRGCTATESVTVSAPSEILLDIVTTPANCGDEDGTATVAISGGVSPYSYNWSTGGTDSEIHDLAAGYYMLTITDVNGCIKYAVVIVNNSSTLNISVAGITGVTCSGGSNGAIDIDISGGLAPYIYEWSNGATTQDISGIPAGSYEIMVTDDSGCMTASSIEVTGPEPLTVVINLTPANCGNSDGTATAAITGGITPYNYLWSSSDTDADVVNLAAGAYSLVVTDANGCIKLKMFSVSNAQGPVISQVAITGAGCNAADGNIDIFISGGTMPFTYVWSDGSTTEDLNSLASGQYSLTITDDNGCITAGTYHVNVQLPLENPICMVFVDSILSQNKVVWEKVQETGIDHYLVYRETYISGQYQAVASVPYNDLSEWLDPFANPMTRPWKYKLSAVDSCGNESPLSTAHKTLHLTVNEGLSQTVNLIWDSYQGFPYYSFYVYRHTDQTGWVPIDTLPSTVWTYTDDPGNWGHLWYVVSVIKDFSCISTGAGKTQGGPYSQSFSNLDDNIIVTAIAEAKQENSLTLLLYPNPANDKLYIEIFGGKNVFPVHVQIYNTDGKALQRLQLNNTRAEIDISSLASGIYALRFDNGKVCATKIIVKR
ncbi:MAG: T9SS type A sorting domain-containing protein, partial [Bacteroidia bacterium]|nr:T9SS type A sorting domain-containing protein [Bacteroidia bacterium]